MQIDYLADHLEFLSILARWHHDEWGYLHPGETIEGRMARLRAECGRREIPTTVVAFAGAALLGSAMLVDHDMETRMELSPWLGGVFVAPGHRGQGIGTALVRRIMSEAEALGVPQLYLYTPGAEEFYSRLGWSVVERISYRETAVTVMTFAARVGEGNLALPPREGGHAG